MNDVKNCTRRMRRYCSGIVGCFSVLLAFAVDCGDKPSGGGFGNTVQLPDGQLVSAYTYRGEDGNAHAEVLRWILPEPAKK